MLRVETRVRARTLQVLYAWELLGKPDVARVVPGVLRLFVRQNLSSAAAETLAAGIVAHVVNLDVQIVDGAEHWRLERIGTVERNILRIALHELIVGDVPPKVVIDEAVRLARWFAGPKAPAFANGVVDGFARRLGCL